jgi:S-adenosylhomocysteine hydrolase
MSLKNIDMAGVMRRLADKRIEDAMAEGKFDNLEGAGKPIELEDLPANENARMLWWALRIMRNNNFTPDEVRWRKQVDVLKAELDSTINETRLEALCAQINELARKINTLGTNAIASGVVGVDIDEQRVRLAERRKFNPGASS